MQKVFISYSWKDEVIALRLYRELQHMNISVWLDRIDGEKTGDFQKEFLFLINQCDYFIVIDSNNYRHKSQWCEIELKACFDRIDLNHKVKIIVCLVEKIGDWRSIDTIFGSEKKYLFERLNTLKYINFVKDGHYDNERIYYNGIEAIYRILGKESYSWDIFPEEMDLVDEMDYAIRLRSDICDNDRESLKYLLRSAILRRNQQRDIYQYLELIINTCQELKLKIFLPKWLAAIWFADKNNKYHSDKKCIEYLKELEAEFPEDMRIYRGLGAMYARLNNQKKALSYFQKALALVEENKTVRYELYCNVGQIYMNMRRYSDAKNAMEYALSLLDSSDFNVNLISNYYECLLFLGHAAEAGIFMKKMVDNNPTVAEFQKLYGYYCLYKKEVGFAMPYFEKAYSMFPSPENAYLLLCCLLKCGNIELYKQILFKEINNDSNTKEDEFWINKIRKLPLV